MRILDMSQLGSHALAECPALVLAVNCASERETRLTAQKSDVKDPSGPSQSRQHARNIRTVILCTA